MKVLLFGKDGQVGRALQGTLPALGELVALGHDDADFEQPDSLAAIIAEVRPDAIVNAAAFTAVDKAESDQHRAITINTGAVGAIGLAARRIGALLLHYSTDYVFDGTKGAPYVETDPVNPQSVYGRSKLMGEVALEVSGADRLILRICWVHSPWAQNFPMTVLKLARERDGIDVVSDQIGIPTPAMLVAEVSTSLLMQALADRGLCGTYHLAATGGASRHEIATYVVEGARRRGATLRLDAAQIRPALSKAFPTPAPRPADSRLDTAKLAAVIAQNLPSWQQGIDELLDALAKEGRLD